MPRTPLSPETKIGIPLAAVAALIGWNLVETIALKERVARIEGRLEERMTALVAPPPQAPDLPAMPSYATGSASPQFPARKDRQP